MKTLIIYLLISFPALLFATTEYKYIDIKGEIIQLGNYKGAWSLKTDKTNLNFSDYKQETIADYLNIKNGEKVLIYFHSLLGGVNVYHKNTVKKLKEIEGMDKVISVVWHTKELNYVNSWNQAIQTSKLYKPIVGNILENNNIDKYILCHSMGHRIFEGIVKDYSEGSVSIEKIIFTGSDLDLDVFEKSLATLPSLSKNIFLYVHRKDRLLQKSKRSHKRERLGLDGLRDDFGLASIDNLERIDVTNSSGSKFIRLTNHIYFKRDKEVLSDINLVLNSSPDARKSNFIIGKDNIRYIE